MQLIAKIIHHANTLYGEAIPADYNGISTIMAG
jgi:hypothetical protein